eukprot:Gb_30720 [translate_table: standard]
MALSYWDDEEEDEEFETMGDQFDNDMDALRRACQLTGEDHGDVEDVFEGELDEDEEENEEVDDEKYLRSIQQKLLLGASQVQIPQKAEIAKRPLESDVEEDDADILRAIQNRFTDPGLSEKPSISNGMILVA